VGRARKGAAYDAGQEVGFSQLRWIAEGDSHATVATPAAARRKNRELVAWIAAAAGVLAAVLLALALIHFREKLSPGDFWRKALQEHAKSRWEISA